MREKHGRACWLRHSPGWNVHSGPLSVAAGDRAFGRPVDGLDARDRSAGRGRWFRSAVPTLFAVVAHARAGSRCDLPSGGCDRSTSKSSQSMTCGPKSAESASCACEEGSSRRNPRRLIVETVSPVALATSRFSSFCVIGHSSCGWGDTREAPTARARRLAPSGLGKSSTIEWQCLSRRVGAR